MHILTRLIPARVMIVHAAQANHAGMPLQNGHADQRKAEQIYMRSPQVQERRRCRALRSTPERAPRSAAEFICMNVDIAEQCALRKAHSERVVPCAVRPSSSRFVSVR